MNLIVSLAAVAGTFFLCACAGRPPLSTVPSVDLQRYSGRWHEIARYPNWFQRECAGSAIAEYTPQPDDGSIRVVNTCPRKDGSLRTIVGTGTVVPGSGNARLKVRFFGPFAGDYWIIGLDEKNYSWALVGHPSRRFLWILAREPTMKESLYKEIVAIAVRKGYMASRIRHTPSSISF